MITFQEYQDATAETAIYAGRGTTMGLAYTALGLNGEAGECGEKVKKAIRDDDGVLTEERRRALAGECGDVLWYLARLADEAGLDLGEIAEGNLAKLRSRKERGVLGGSGDAR